MRLWLPPFLRFQKAHFRQFLSVGQEGGQFPHGIEKDGTTERQTRRPADPTGKGEDGHARRQSGGDARDVVFYDGTTTRGTPDFWAAWTKMSGAGFAFSTSS